jgi:hypothetical protein
MNQFNFFAFVCNLILNFLQKNRTELIPIPVQERNIQKPNPCPQRPGLII